jgi:hypothetical protein
MSTFNNGFIQSGDGNLAEPVHVGRTGQQVVFSSVNPAESYAALYPTIESVPSNFNGTVDIVTPTYRATVKGDGVNKYTTGFSDIENRPIASVIGKGEWAATDGISYTSDGISYESVNKQTLNTIMCYGDSITALCNYNYHFAVGDTGSVSNGVLTLTTAAGSFNFLPGSEFYLQNLDQDAYVDRYVVATSTANTVTATTTAANGTITFNSNSYMIFLWNSSEANFITWACSLSNGAFRKGYNIGFSGQLSSYCLNKFDKFITNGNYMTPKNTIFCEFSGVNGLAGGVAGTALSTFNDRQQIWKKAKGLGYKVCIFTVGPVGNLNAGWTSTTAREVIKHNNLCKQFVLDNPDYLLYDQYSTCIDPASQYGNFKANYLPTGDYIHRSGLAAYNMGKDLLTAIQAGLKSQTRQLGPESCTENYAYVGGDNNVMDTALCMTSLGALANTGILTGGATGVGMTGYVIGQLTAATCAASLPARADGFGYNQRIIYTTTADSQSPTFQTLITVTGRIPAGKRIVMQAEIALTSLTAYKRLDFNLSITSGTQTTVLSPCTHINDINDQTDKTLIFEFGDVGFVTPATCDYSFYIRPTHSGVGGGTIDIGKLKLYYY